MDDSTETPVRQKHPPKLPHVVLDDGFGSWLMTYSERHDRDSPTAHEQVLSATEAWG